MNKRTYFDTLDGLRFIAFFLVFLSHLPFSKNSWISYFSQSGNVGVSFFFVLSGFLISYLLLLEKQHTGGINLKKFLMRRILRIWPLFYAMLLFAYLSPFILEIINLPFSNAGYEPNWWFSFFFLENYMIISEGINPNVAPLTAMWTLCVEEHFYILWGVLLCFINNKHIPKLIFISIFITIVSRILFANYQLSPVDITTNLSYFALGTIPAYIYVEKPLLLDKLETLHPTVKYLIVATTVTYILITSNNNSFELYMLDATFMGGLFAAGILFTLPQQNRLSISRKSLISKWGIYTYGLYLFHTVIIAFYNRLFEFYEIHSYSLVFVSAFVSALVVSYASYHLFESKFLALKKSYV